MEITVDYQTHTGIITLNERKVVIAMEVRMNTKLLHVVFIIILLNCLFRRHFVDND